MLIGGGRPVRGGLVDGWQGVDRLAQTSERENAGTTSLGALLRAKLDNQNSNNG